MPNVARPAPGSRRGRPVGKVTDKQVVWVAEYLKDLNGARAAAAAGYSHPAVAAAKLLNPGLYPHVVREVRRRLAEKREDCRVEAARIVAELVKIAFFDPRDLLDEKGNVLPLKELPGDVAAAVARLELTYAGDGARVRRDFVRFHSKIAALRLIAELLGYLRPQPLTPPNDGPAGGAAASEEERREAIRQVLCCWARGSGKRKRHPSCVGRGAYSGCDTAGPATAGSVPSGRGLAATGAPTGRG
jgi:phage terminase small subunit